MATRTERKVRSHRFAKHREPGRLDTDLHLVQDDISGPFSSLNPTTAYLKHTASEAAGRQPLHPSSDDGSEEGDESTAPPGQRQQGQLTSHVQYRWTSRNNRKGRHELVATPASESTAQYLVPPRTNTPKTIVTIIGRMVTDYPYWDISWLVAYLYTWGSMIWVINAFFSWLPLVDPSTAFPNESLYGGGITAFIGAMVFELGSILLFLEAVNENQEGCFGWAVKEVYHGHKGTQGPLLALAPDRDGCTHHHVNQNNLVGGPQRSSNSDQEAGRGNTPQSDRHWTWCPSWSALKSHYFHEIGFLACTAQLLGSTIFCISGFTALPGILNKLSPRLENGIYWTPQVVGGVGFILAGTLFTLETQKKWYIPAFNTLGWHIGIWNLIGAIGFTVCPALGYNTSSWAQYQAGLSTFWGSWAFLIGSLIQLYESLQKHPVSVESGTSAQRPEAPSSTAHKAGS